MKFSIGIIALIAAAVALPASHAFAGPATGDGNDTPAYYNELDDRWYQINANAFGETPIKFKLGIGVPGNTLVAISGDWNGDGVATPGYYNPADQRWYQFAKSEFGSVFVKFKFGTGAQDTTTQIPVVGDWDGNGTDTPGYFDRADDRWWQINANAFGETPTKFKFGIGVANSSLVPVAGNWDGAGGDKGTDTPGYFNLNDNRWWQINENAFGATPIKFKGGIGVSTTTLTPIVGDWNGDGTTTPGFFNGADERWHQLDANAFGAGITKFKFGIGVATANLQPTVGDWDGTTPE